MTERSSVLTERSMKDVAFEHLRIFAAGDVAAVNANVTVDYFNHRSADEPLAARQPGREGYKVTLAWIRRAFTDMRFELLDCAVNGDLVALHVAFHGRQHGPFVVYDSPDGRVTDVFPSRDRSFSVRHTHWITVRDGAVSEHDAVRDDLGMARQLGWIPPNPAYIARMVLALRRERRADSTGKPL